MLYLKNTFSFRYNQSYSPENTYLKGIEKLNNDELPEALAWIQFAAQEKHLPAISLLGDIYEDGLKGVPVDKEKAQAYQAIAREIDKHDEANITVADATSNTNAH